MLSGSRDMVVVDSVVYDGRTVPTPSTTLSGLSGGVEYAYVVATMSSAGEGDRSTALSASTSPPAPTDLSSVSQTTSSISLSWSAPVVTSGAAVTGYEVYQSVTGGTAAALSCGGDALSTTCEATARSLGNALDVIAHNLTVTLGGSLAFSFARYGHD